jgi:hypothetical protein
MDTESDTLAMNPKQEYLLLAGVCFLFVLLALGSLGWAALSSLLRDIDGLLLTLVALVSALIFGVQGWLLIKKSAALRAPAAGSQGEQDSAGAAEPPASKESS